jgi:hypothetical protein
MTIGQSETTVSFSPGSFVVTKEADPAEVEFENARHAFTPGGRIT